MLVKSLCLASAHTVFTMSSVSRNLDKTSTGVDVSPGLVWGSPAFTFSNTGRSVFLVLVFFCRGGTLLTCSAESCFFGLASPGVLSPLTKRPAHSRWH